MWLYFWNTCLDLIVWIDRRVKRLYEFAYARKEARRQERET